MKPQASQLIAFKIVVASFVLGFMGGCMQLDDISNAAPEATNIQYALESAVDGSVEGTADLKFISTSTERFIAQKHQVNSSWFDNFVGFLSQPLWAAADQTTSFDVPCQTGFNDHISTSGKVSYAAERNNFSTANAHVYTVKTFDKCARNRNLYEVTGTVRICHTRSGNNFSDPIIADSVEHRRGANYTVKNKNTGTSVTVEPGTGASGMSCTISNSTTPSGNLTHLLVFSGVSGTYDTGFSSTITITTKMKRTGTNSAGSTLFVHEVTSGAGVGTTLQASSNAASSSRTRTFTGTVQNSISNPNTSTLTLTYSSAVFSMTDCLPTSGSASFTVTGDMSGSGSITFQNNSATYSYTNSNGKQAAGTLNLPGCRNR